MCVFFDDFAVRISTAPFHQRLQMMDTLKEPLHSTSTDEQRLEHVSFLLDGIAQVRDYEIIAR